MATPRQGQRNNKTKLGRKNQVTLPQEIVDDAGIQTGSALNVSIIKRARKVPKGSIVLSPEEHNSQPWSDEEWKEKIREAKESVARGETYGPFDTATEAVKFLKKYARAYRSRQ